MLLLSQVRRFAVQNIMGFVAFGATEKQNSGVFLPCYVAVRTIKGSQTHFLFMYFLYNVHPSV